MTATRGVGRGRSFEFRLRFGLTTMLVPLGLAMMLLLFGMIGVTSNQHAVRTELNYDLTTVSELRRDLAEAAQLVAAFEPARAGTDAAKLHVLNRSVDTNLELARASGSPAEAALLIKASDEWHAAVDAADRLFAAAVYTPDRDNVLHRFDLVADDVVQLDQLSRADTEAAVQASTASSEGIMKVAVAIGLLAFAANMFQIPRLLAAAFGPLRQLRDDLAEFSVTDLEHRIGAVGDREFQEVGDAFNAMADRLQDTLGSLEHQAFHDVLTGLPNRANLVRHLQQPGPDGRVVVLFDLDGFKAINDGLGHAAGDEALIQIGHRVHGALDSGDVVARLGGDEFAVVLNGPTSADDADDMAAGIARRVSEPMEIAGRSIVLNASGGLAPMVPGEDPTEVIRRADIALYVAKEHTKGGVRRFLPEMLHEVEQQVELETDLRTALARGEIEVYYQPTVEISNGAVTGVEALARWRHPKQGMISPVSFIPVAEATGEIVALGRFVLDTACAQAVAWHLLPGLADLSMSVNVSAVQLHSSNILDHVAGALRHSGLAPASLTLEVTETVMADPDAVARVHQLKSLGVRVALDDFGTGYSSLSYLQRLPIDILKIDKSFIDDLGVRADRDVLTSAIVRLGRSLGLETVAEGVEQGAQLRVLTAVGCEIVQGYLFAEPAAAADTEARLLELVAVGKVLPQESSETETVVHVEVGPLSAAAARDWLQHAHWALDEVETGRLAPGAVPATVLPLMRGYVDRWTLCAMEGDTFMWTADEDVQLLAVLMRFWQPISEALAQAARSGTFIISQGAGDFSDTMVHALLVALATHDGTYGTEAANLARSWPSHDAHDAAAALVAAGSAVDIVDDNADLVPDSSLRRRQLRR